MKSGCANHSEEIATLESVSRYSWEQRKTNWNMYSLASCLQDTIFSKEPGTID